MAIVSRLLLVLLLNVLRAMIGHAAPLLDTKDTWNRNVFASVVKATCSPNGQCWGWLPTPENYDVIIPEQDTDTSRLQSRRQIANPVSELTLRSWKDGTLEETGQDIRPSLRSNKQVPTRIMKKDVFVSRSWGVRSGMPFSVLYMNPHSPRSNHAVTATSTSQRQESGTTTENSIPFEHSNSRIPSRNGQPTVQSRRQYWTIPQLFISYGWGPFGK